jgi:hypothetical protein
MKKLVWDIQFKFFSWFNYSKLEKIYKNKLNGKLQLNYYDFLQLVKNHYYYKLKPKLVGNSVPKEMPCYWFIDCKSTILFIGGYDYKEDTYAVCSTGDASNTKYLSLSMIRTIMRASEKKGNRNFKFGKMKDYVNKDSKNITMGELF